MFSHISPLWGRFFQVSVITFTIRTVKLFLVFLWRGKRKFCIVAFGMLKEKKTLYMITNLRWLNTVFACALADVIQHMHKDCKKKKHAVDSAIILFIIEWKCIDSLGLLLQRYVKKAGIDAKNPALFRFFCTQKNLVKCIVCLVSQKNVIEYAIAF